MVSDYHEYLESVIAIAIDAGAVIKNYDRSDCLQVKTKQDDTPVTIVDKAANDFIVRELKKLTPAIPIISEEAAFPDLSADARAKRCWLVDPLDGTRGFIAGSKEYTVNIALIEHHQAVLGVICAPEFDACYYAMRDHGAFKKLGKAIALPLKTCEPLIERWKVLVSHFHHTERLQALIAANSQLEFVPLNSSLKFCYIAEGLADFYLRLGPTSEWDTAAGQCIVEQSGGVLVDLKGEKLQYIASNTVLNPNFIAIGCAAAQSEVLAMVEHLRRQS